MIKVNIVPSDSREVAKVVIIDNSGRVLLLKRSNYVKKYAGEWDLPGGHVQIGERIIDGLKREVKEETSLSISSPVFIKKMDNLHFYYCFYNNEPITISHEHTGFRFFKKANLDPNEKFQKVALEALEKTCD